jgi:serine/threonine protein kinase
MFDIINFEDREYKMIKFIDEGISGSVYLYIDNMNILYAIKFTKEDINNEIDCLEKINDICDEYFLCYVTSFVYDEYNVIVTKFLEGYITLNEYMGQFNKDDYDEYEREEIYENIKDQLLNGINMLHNINIIHGDIHDENILIDPETIELRYIDFGKCSKCNKHIDKNIDISRLNIILEDLYNIII